ncbi:MAG: hypothetical protein GC168_21620 [Candidatus Hydrogenedens sp.]|nr:hypothetical protein [Candidatus Hydrogenedens sp.]
MIRSNIRVNVGEPYFRILQLTDLHTDAGERAAAETYANIEKMVARHRPHFLAITGDVWCSDDTPGQAWNRMLRDFKFLDTLQVLWAFTPGNHDHADDWSMVQDWLAESPYACTEPERGPGNEVIALYGDDTSCPLWELLFVNSGQAWDMPDLLSLATATKPGHVPFRENPVPSIFFFHIPLRAYQEAIDQGEAIGVAKEDVLFTGDEYGEGVKLFTLYDGARACFCGHSHRNDFYFIRDGVTFSYGRATGTGSYGDDLPKGAKLIELDTASDRFRFRTVLPDGTVWSPDLQ